MKIHTGIQTASVYGLPSKDSVRQLTESEAFRFGYRHALNGIVAIYMGPHVAAFEAGCQTGQEVRDLKASLASAREDAEMMRNQRDGLVKAIKATRTLLQDTQQKLDAANGALARQALNRSILFSPFFNHIQ